MKKFNFNLIIFVSCAVLILGGWCSRPLMGSMFYALVDFVKEPNMDAFIAAVDEGSQKISYKGALLDLYSLNYRYTDTRVVEKPDATVVRLDNGYLSYVHDELSEDDLDSMVKTTVQIRDIAEQVGAPLIYLMVPDKSYYGGFPDDTENYYPQYYEFFAGRLKENEVDFINGAEKMAADEISMEEAFFAIDHHWKPEMGFWMAGKICEKLSSDYGFSYDASLMSIENYDVKVYEDFFFGSQGKKVGQYFTSLGQDDFSLITPKFDTDLTVTDSRGKFEGKFEDTVLDLSFMEKIDKYTDDSYATYSGGDLGLQVVDNQYIEDGAKILLIRNSFARVVSPFLSLVADEVHTVDVRYWEGTEQSETILEYIEEMKPDYVLILYHDFKRNMFEFEK